MPQPCVSVQSLKRSSSKAIAALRHNKGHARNTLLEPPHAFAVPSPEFLMHIRTFTVEGFAGFTRPMAVGPLHGINVFHGANNTGKSCLLRAVDLYFRLLGAGEAVTKAQRQILDDAPAELWSAFRLRSVARSRSPSSSAWSGRFPSARCKTPGSPWITNARAC